MTPQVFERENPTAELFKGGPFGAFTIDGKPYFYYGDEHRLRLVSADGRSAFQTPPEAAGRWSEFGQPRRADPDTVALFEWHFDANAQGTAVHVRAS